MFRKFTYCVICVLALSACETVYETDLDKADEVVVVESLLWTGGTRQVVQLHWSRGFYDKRNFTPVSNADVKIIDDRDNIIQCNEISDGMYTAYFNVKPAQKFKLLIVVGDDTYESELEEAPPIPSLDKLYSEETEKIVVQGGETSVENFFKVLGHQFYVDINTGDSVKYYRFYARKVLQFYFNKDTSIGGHWVTLLKYGWKSIYPNETFNIAEPNAYSVSKNIYKHPVEFFGYTEEALLDSGQVGLGWIYIIHEYGITKSSYRFYNDLNSQLESNGKIFDPMYTQARGNLICTSDKNKTVLGNFEVASYRQYRYYLRLESNVEKQYVRKLDTFYDIPEKGIKVTYPPKFWED